MQAVYRALDPQEIPRILECCRRHSARSGGPFEVYPGPGGDMHMVIVNSRDGDGSLDALCPVGVFYLNYSGPGVISIEEEDPHYDGMPSRKNHVAALKEIIDRLIRYDPSNDLEKFEIPPMRSIP